MNSIVVKLGLAIASLFLMVLLPLGYVINNVLTNYFYNKAFQDVTLQTQRLVDIISQSQDMDTPNLVVNIMKLTNNTVFLLDASQRIVVQSQEGQTLSGFLTADDWCDLQVGTPVKKHINQGDPHWILVGYPIISKAKFAGAVLILDSTVDIEASISEVRQFIWLSGIGTMLVAFGVTWVIVRKFTTPLLEMEQATRRISKGDLNTRVKQRSNDEIGSLAEAINDLAADLKKLQDNRSEFFSNISHELRTPLTYIEGYVKVLQEEMPEDANQRQQMMQIILSETKRLKGLVNDLFDLSKLEEGKIELTLEWIDLSEVIENALESVRLRGEEKGLQFEVHQERVPLMYLDGNRMQQVFINLLDNGIRYTEKGTLTVNLKEQDEWILIEVKDTGVGIPEEELPYIFERFHRVEKSRSREYGGTGLGLAIVKKLVELQGGTTHVESRQGEGTSFTMKFPLTPGERSKNE